MNPRIPYVPDDEPRPDEGGGAVFWLVWAVLFLSGLALLGGGFYVALTPSVPWLLSLVAVPGALALFWCLRAALVMGEQP